ncbi:MAG TPA: zf-HC2 domain-containing protein [Terriglobales bacterium]|nr:zf-HC2 domain-containing protein [Terriglobales bacterium]
MKHIAQEKLVEFVREVLPQAEIAAVREHLNGCSDCSQTVALFRDVLRVGGSELAYEPPAGIIQIAKAYFASEQNRIPQSTTAFELLFDSLAQPVAAGARAASVASARQLLYRVGTVYVDMRVDSENNSERAALVGQMLDSAHPNHPVSGVPVVLLDGRKNVASTISNTNGEFHLEFALKSNLRLSVTVGNLAPVYLPITGISERKRPSDPSRGPN